MKLRLRGNSLRLRLTKSEVVQLADAGVVSETTGFGPSPEQQLHYCLRVIPMTSALIVTFTERRIEVGLPSFLAQQWMRTEQISLHAEQAIDAEQILSILVEKDFVCLQPRVNEDDQDGFPNPKADLKPGLGICHD